jgi:hypothetical protein
MEPNPEIIAALRESATYGANIRALVTEIRSRQAGMDDPTLMVLWYLMRAFCLRLTDVLPVRDWLAGAKTDEEIDLLVTPRIAGARRKWSQNINGSDGPVAPEATRTAHGLPVETQRS